MDARFQSARHPQLRRLSQFGRDLPGTMLYATSHPNDKGILTAIALILKSTSAISSKFLRLKHLICSVVKSPTVKAS